MKKSHDPKAGDFYRLPSGRVVKVLTVYPTHAACEYQDGDAVTLSIPFLVNHGWKQAA